MNLHEPNVTINEIRKSPKKLKQPEQKESNSKPRHKNHHHHKRDALGNSTAISTAVAGATSLLQSVINNTEKPNGRTSTSNSSMNTIKPDREIKKKTLPSSASEQVIHRSNKVIDKRYWKERDSNTDEEYKLLKTSHC